jgi:Flp pilus assembly protein TadB
VSQTHRYDVRASDLDRERAVEFLKAHYAAGRLQHDELAARTDAAYRAVALSELDWLTSDLPAIFRPPRRRGRRVSPVAVILIFAVFAALIVVVPPDAWLALLAIGALIAIVGFFVLAPLAVPMALLAGVVYLIVRATRPRPQQRRVGWR